MIIIDDDVFNIPVVSLRRIAEFLDKYAERTESGDLQRELIGVFYKYVLQFGRTNNTTEYESLWQKLTEPVEFHTIVIPDGDGDPITFTAYFSGVSDELKKEKDSKTFWKNLTVTFISKSAIGIPS